MQQDVLDVRATARTRDGTVRVEVGPHGELRDLRIDQRAYDRMSPPQLSQTVMKLVGEAAEEAKGRVRELTGEFLPPELAERLRQGEEDLTVYLPDAPRLAGEP